MRIILTILVLTVLVSSAYAQTLSPQRKPHSPEEDAAQIEQRQKKQRDADKAYKSKLDAIPDKKPVDPWAKIR